MSEPVKVLPMAKLLRLAREKEERERAQKEASASSTSANESATGETYDPKGQGQAPQQTIVSPTIVSETRPQETIPKQTIPQHSIVTESELEFAEDKRQERKRQRKTGSEDLIQSPQTAIPSSTIVRQSIVNSDKGYYPIFNDISDRLIPEMQLDPYQQAVLQRLYRLSRGWKSEECEVGLGTLAKYCVMSRSQVQRSIAKLIEKGLLENLGSSKKGGKEGNRYRVLPGLKSTPRQTIVGETIVAEGMTGDTIVRDDETSSSRNTVVNRGIVSEGINKNSNKELKDNTHTRPNAGVGSKFSLEECKRFAEHLQKTGQGINNPGGYATTIFRSGEFDAQIEAFLKPSARFESSNCPDCGGSGYYYPEGVEKGVKICKHEKLR